MNNVAQSPLRQLMDRARASTAARSETLFSGFRKRWHRFALPLLLPANPPAESDKWAIFAFNTVSPARIASATMLMRGMMRCGWHVKFVYAGHGFDRLADPGNEISGGLVARHWHFARLASAPAEPAAWDVDLDNGRVEAGGCNFFKLFENTLSAYVRRYQPDLNDPKYGELVRSIFETAKASLEIALRIETAARNGKRIVLVTEEAHAVGNGTLHEYFNHPTRRGMIDIYLQQEAYSNYVKGVLYDRNILLTHSADPDAYSAFFITRKEFLPWYERLSDAAHTRIASSLKPMLQPSYIRTPKEFSPTDEASEKIKAARNANIPVYCLFAHVLFDRAKFDRAGPFDNMCDWVQKTVDAFRDIDGLLLLKPHPWELGALQFTPEERLGDALAGISLPENVVLLKPDEFDSRHIMQLIDGAIVWQSTALLEMIIAGIPCAYCGPPSYYAEPLDLTAPENMEAYRNDLRHLPSHPVSDDEKRRAMAVLYLLNIARVIPVDLIRHVPFGIAETRIVSPVQFLRALLDRESYSGRLAETIEIGYPSAIGPLAESSIISQVPPADPIPPVDQMPKTRVAS